MLCFFFGCNLPDCSRCTAVARDERARGSWCWSTASGPGFFSRSARATRQHRGWEIGGSDNLPPPSRGGVWGRGRVLLKVDDAPHTHLDGSWPDTPKGSGCKCLKCFFYAQRPWGPRTPVGWVLAWPPGQKEVCSGPTSTTGERWSPSPDRGAARVLVPMLTSWCRCWFQNDGWRRLAGLTKMEPFFWATIIQQPVR